jgi:hypothetical protein
MIKATHGSDHDVTDDQLRAGEEGLRRLLFSKRFPREWIDRHTPEVMAQARAELAGRLACENVNDVVALLVVIAYRRAMKVLRSETTRPRMISLDDVFHLVDESARTPEQEVLASERQVRLLDAMGHLFGELTVKDAGEQLGWSPSSAVRHQRAALEKLRSLVGDRSLLGVDIALPAAAASNSFTPQRSQVGGWLRGIAESFWEVLTLGVQRYGPMTETGNAIALSGAARTTAGACGIAVAACLTAFTSGLVGPGVGGIRPSDPDAHHDTFRRPMTRPAAPVTVSVENKSIGLSWDDQAADRSSPKPPRRRHLDARPPHSLSGRRTARSKVNPTLGSSSHSSPSQTVSEFGVEEDHIEATGAISTGSEQPSQTPSVPRPSAASSITPPPSTGTDAEFGM